LQYTSRIYLFNNAVIDKRLFRDIQLQATKTAALLYMVQGFIDDYFLKPAVEFPFVGSKELMLLKHFDKSMAQDVGRLMFVGSHSAWQ